MVGPIPGSPECGWASVRRPSCTPERALAGAPKVNALLLAKHSRPPASASEQETREAIWAATSDEISLGRMTPLKEVFRSSDLHGLVCRRFGVLQASEGGPSKSGASTTSPKTA